MAGNTKGHSAWLTGLVAPTVVGLIFTGANRYFSREGENNDTLVATVAELKAINRRLERIENQSVVTRAEYERDASRFERRLDDIERRFKFTRPESRPE